MGEVDQPLPWPDEEGAASNEAPRETALTVTQVNRMARQLLEEHAVTVQGEVSGLATGYAYFVYFDLRDHESSLPALLTQRQLKALDFKLEDGAVVLVSGTLTIYEKQGKYQIKVLDIQPFGEGELQRRIDALKKKLHAEGLFEDAIKKPLPRFPAGIGVISSPRGAAIRDVVVTLGRRFPPARVYVRGVRVQGAGAVEQVCAALDFFDSDWPVDLVILARGGGSLQDLEPFNSEEVARAILRMDTPVISGIGHEPDVTIADLVADLRASTPTGAAEAAVPDRAEVSAFLSKTAGAMSRRILDELRAWRGHVRSLTRRPLYKAPDSLLGAFMQRWERAAGELPESPRRGLLKRKGRLSVVSHHPVYRRRPELLGGAANEHEARRQEFSRAARVTIERRATFLARLKARFHALSPVAVLERGYSITFNRETGKVVRASDEVDPGAHLRIRLGRGELDADVTGKE